MKQKIVFLLLLIGSISLFTACEEEELLAPMNGYWKCTGINGTAAGFNTSSIESKYLNLFSVGYVGIGSAGYFTRTGAEDLSSAAGAIAVVTGGSTGGAAAWENFFTSGTYTYNTTEKTVTHNLENGETESFSYKISADGNTLTLTKETETAVSGTINSVVSVLNAILGSNTVNTSVGIVYTYQKSSVAEIIAAINNSTGS